MPALVHSADALRSAIRIAAQGLIERDTLIELIALAAVAREHLLVIGPPGTAKSEAVRRMAQATGGNYFEYLLGRFTEPNEVFGPVDLRRLREGMVETATAGMLPEAEIAFLDEVFQGSTAILNTLLGILNERIFRRGHTRLPCPLRLCVGASNALPADDSLAAFADRFLVRAFVDPIADPMLEDLLAGGWSIQPVDTAPAATALAASMADIDALAEAARACDLTAVRPLLSQALRQLRAAGIALSDRRSVKAQKLIAAAAVLDGREAATPADLWPLLFAIPTREQQALARDTLRDLLAPARNESLPAASEDASAGPAARAVRLERAATELFALPEPRDDAWKLKLEGVAREIDSGFDSARLPAGLAATRTKIVEALRGMPAVV